VRPQLVGLERILALAAWIFTTTRRGRCRSSRTSRRSRSHAHGANFLAMLQAIASGRKLADSWSIQRNASGAFPEAAGRFGVLSGVLVASTSADAAAKSLLRLASRVRWRFALSGRPTQPSFESRP